MKYKNIKKSTKVGTFMDNLFLAVTDMHVDMVVTADISPAEAKRLILRNVKLIIDENVKEFTK
tara:strand:- start:292 stop:480 length:189 start_codon:yes stop_codon:yes gene_type:complete